MITVGTQLIFDLLGLRPDTDVARLRSVYEGAVSAATARGDWTRATQLSRAFDQLPDEVRVAVYPGRDRDAPRWESAPRNVRRGRGTSRLSPTGQARRIYAIVLVGVWAIVCLIAVGTWLVHHPPSESGSLVLRNPSVGIPSPPATASPLAHTAHREYGRPAMAHRRPVQGTWSPLRAVYPGSGEVRIPSRAVLDRRGLAHVLCPTGPTGASWRLVVARPGQFFTCPSGYVGLVLVPAR